jgi:hypothetical protein
MSAVLHEMMEKISAMSPEQKAEVRAEVDKATEKVVWIPSPGPQTMAYNSEADVLLYGGEPGGGKSSLLIGLAFMEHKRSLIMRRQYTDLGHIIEEVQKFNGGKEGFNGSPPPKLKRPDGKVIDLGAASRVGDEQHWQGNPHDFIGIDEATQFAKIQIQFLMGWLRCADDPEQRTRVVLATNPPLEAEGLWVTEMFAPWLDDKYLNPAKPGELRWAIMGEEDNNVWVDGPGEHLNHLGKMVVAKSYTYIPAALQDNPFLARTDYARELDAMPESIRSIMMGGFKTAFKDAADQVIPTEWVRLAQDRWRPFRPEAIPMCNMGVDCTGGGTDPLVIAPRYDGYFDPLIEIKARDIPLDAIGKTTVGHIIANRRDGSLITIDMGGGYGGSTYELLAENEVEVKAYKGAEKTTRRSSDKKLHFTNTRTAALWQFREALDPGQPGGSPIQLPPSRKLLADLTAPTYKVTPNGIQAESKEHVCERLGRSTNDGDAVIMSWYWGAKEENAALDFIDRKIAHKKRGQAPRVITGRTPRTGRGKK